MILPYATQVVQPLKVLFLQDNFSDIPDITLKSNSDLSIITSNVATLAINAVPVSDKQTQVDNIFEDIFGYMDDSDNILRLQSLEYTSKAIASVIENSYATLNTIVSETVDSIKKDADDRYIVLMKREKAESLITTSAVEAMESDYMFLKWGRLESPMMQNEVLETATSNAGISNNDLSQLNLSYITRKTNFSTGFKDITLPKEVSETIVNKLVAVFVNDETGITEDMVKTAWGFFTKKERYSYFCENTEMMFHDVKNVATNCMSLVKTSEALSTIGEAIARIASDDLSTETLNTLSNNVESVSKTNYAIQYWLIAAKELTFKDKLIVSPSVLNEPVYHDFVQQGKTVVDIHNYLKAFHLNTTIPLNGISSSTVMLANSIESLERSNAKLNENAPFIKTKCLVSAYEHAIRSFVTNKTVLEMFPKLKDQANITMFVRVAMMKADSLSGNTANLDKVLYDLLITSFYSGTLTSTLHSYLDKGYGVLTQGSIEDISDENIVDSQCESTIEMLVDYLFDKVVEKKSN